MGFTTTVNGHRHKWEMGNDFTNWVDGHKHRIDFKRMLALSVRKGTHSHRLLITKRR